MTYRNWDRAHSQTSYKRRWEGSQKALAQAMRENRVRAECLEIAIKALYWYGNNCPVLFCVKAGEALDKVEQQLAELETGAHNDDRTDVV